MTFKLLSWLRELGRYLEGQGDLDTAIGYHTRAGDSYQRLHGSDHPSTLTSRNNLAYAYRAVGDLGRAIPLYEATLTDSERVLGPTTPQPKLSARTLDEARSA